MAAMVLLCVCGCLFYTILVPVFASTHWVVTEDGRIQSQLDSMFVLRRPYDLVALLRQEERAEMLETLKKELLIKKEEIDKNEDKETGLEQKFYKMDPDCVAAGKGLPEFDLYISTVLPLENKGIRPEEHIDFKAPPSTAPKPPYCTNMVNVDFSLHAFEHLEGMKDRKNLSGTPELGLKNAITHRDNVDDYGHLIYEALKKNQTSWVLYNMAAFYWRIKGDSYHVVECLRRALHFSPRMQKDVALISLGNVLHRARYSNEAAIVVHAALDVSRELNVNHFTLGNIYAVLGDYNKSVICFENTLKIQPDFEAAAKRKHAVKCHSKLEAALEIQHKSLQRTLLELKDYQSKHDKWTQQQEKSLSEQASTDTKLDMRVSYEHYKVSQSPVGVGEHCRMIEKEGRQVIKCMWGKKEPKPDMESFSFKFVATYKDQNRSGSKSNSISEVDYSRPVRPAKYTVKEPYPAHVLNKLPFRHKDWPEKEECDMFVKKFPAWNEFLTNYLPPENKGFDVKVLLTEAQGLKAGVEHPLPWYPPVCMKLSDIPEGSKAYDHIEAVRERAKVPLKLVHTRMKKTLLSHVNNGEVTEEEVGQRILTALKKNIGPPWILYNLAGLYWRVIGNSYHGIECLRRALYHVPQQYRDIPLVNLANILYKWGRVDDALKLMREALSVNSYEPASNVFMGNLLSAKGNLTGAIWHYEQAICHQGDFEDAWMMLRIDKCYQKYHQAAQSAVPKETEVQPLTPGCQKDVANPQQTESRVLCKTENGKETCVVETRTRNKDGECTGMCKQTCTVTPVKVESCASAEGTVTIHTSQCNNGNKCESIGPHGDVTANQKLSDESGDKCGQMGAIQAGDIITTSSSMLHPAFNMKLEEVAEFYKKHGLCSGEECHRMLVQNTAQRPHIRLEVISGILHQKLIYVDQPSDIVVAPTDCVIFNDGSRSAGCAREEYKPYNLDKVVQELLHPLELIYNLHGNQGYPSQPLNNEDDINNDINNAASPQDTLSVGDSGKDADKKAKESHGSDSRKDNQNKSHKNDKNIDIIDDAEPDDGNLEVYIDDFHEDKSSKAESTLTKKKKVPTATLR